MKRRRIPRCIEMVYDAKRKKIVRKGQESYVFQPRKNTTEDPTEEQIYGWSVQLAEAIHENRGYSGKEEKREKKCVVRRTKNWFVIETRVWENYGKPKYKWHRHHPHCFVAKKTGEVYKDKQRKVCYDLRIRGDRELLFDPENWKESLLYAKFFLKYRKQCKDYVDEELNK